MMRGMKKPRRGEELTVAKVAERLEEMPRTVRLWCEQGRFPNADLRDEARGKVWYIPAADLRRFKKPQRGRPRKKTGKAKKS
jgi:hypothetical protein